MTLIIIIIVLAIVFDYLNGFHDAANSIATVVSTRVLTPLQAVIWAAFFNFVAFFFAKFVLGKFGIADTVSKIIHTNGISGPNVSKIIIAGLIAAIFWNILTWWLAIPSSSSHTLMGGITGAAVMAAGFGTVNMDIHRGVPGVLIFIVLAPIIGLLSGNLITLLVLHLAKKAKPAKADKFFKKMQLVSSAFLSITHGLNDSQKVMGIIAATLLANQHVAGLPQWMQFSSFDNIPFQIPFVCFLAIGIGTLSGGFKIMKTMGSRITKISPMEGFCAQLSSSLTLMFTEHVKMPVSTTHVITGSIMGVGSVKRLSAVRWGVTKDLMVAWILTIPVSALLAAGIYWILGFIM